MGIGDWGLGIWGLGIGDWAQSPIPNPQSPIPNPQYYLAFEIILFFLLLYSNNNIININVKQKNKQSDKYSNFKE